VCDEQQVAFEQANHPMAGEGEKGDTMCFGTILEGKNTS